MQALILLDDPARRSALATALAHRGFDVTSLADADAALRHARAAAPDLLVLDERVGGRLVHGLVLLAELRNPCLAAVIVSDRDGEGADELFQLIPSVRAVAPPETAPATLARVALDAHAAAAGEAAEERLDRLWAEAGGDEDEETDEPLPDVFAVPGFLRRPAPLVLLGPLSGPALAARAPEPAGPPRRLHLS